MTSINNNSLINKEPIKNKEYNVRRINYDNDDKIQK